MRLRMVRLLCLMSLMFSLQFLGLGCSSSSSGEGTEEEVAANEEQAAAEGNNNAAEEEGQAANNNETNGAESNGLNADAGGNQNNNQIGQQAENDGLNNAGNALADNNNQGQQGGEEDLQQIIEEMNTANNTQLPNNNNNNLGAINNAGNAANVAAGNMGNVATDTSGMNAAMNQASAVPEAAPPAGGGGGGGGGGGAVAGIPAGPGLPELGSKMTYIVQKGDTLAKIAARIYGDTNKWTEIANFTGLANPRLIYPGDVVYYQLTAQSMKFAGTYDSVKRSEVQIQQGDTLATIAGRVFGNSALWKLIWRQNDKIDNPDRLTAGTTLYYVDPSSMASIEKNDGQEIVKGKSPIKPGKLMTVTKVKNPKTMIYEVANDSLDDLFSQTVSKDLLKRT